MSSQRCDGCGKRVRIGGGIGDFWTFERGSTGGMELDLVDGSEWFLCFECIERLPDDREVTAEDVDALPEHEDADSDGADRQKGADGNTDGGSETT